MFVMNKISALMLAAVVMLSPVVSLPVAADTITVAADMWCPYNCAPDSSKPGIALEILKKAFPDDTIKYELVDWDSAVARTRAGEFDGIVGAARSDAPDFIFPSKSFAYTENCFFTRRKSPWKFAGYDELSKIKLGVIKAYSYGDDIDSYVNKAKPENLMVAEGQDPLADLIKALDSGAIAALVSDKNVFVYSTAEKHKDGAYKADMCGEKDELYIAFSPAKAERSQKLADQLAAGIDALVNKRQMPAIFLRYTGAD
jgi:polar amino acid transport system substrate-binding protein